MNVTYDVISWLQLIRRQRWF